MDDEVTQRALFEAAVHGDLLIVQRFFTQRHIAWIATHDEPIVEQPGFPYQPAYGNWYVFTPSDPSDHLRGFLFNLILQHDQFPVLAWFLSAETTEGVDQSMVHFFEELVATSLWLEQVDTASAIEVVLASHVFLTLLTLDDRQRMLQEVLEQAIRRERDDIIRLVIAHGASLDQWSRRGTRLEYCASFGNVACVERLVESGVFGVQTCLMYGLKRADVTLACIENGADVRGKPGIALLHEAVRRNRLEVVEALLTSGCVDVNALDNNGRTPLIMAASWETERSILHLLLASNADAYLRDKGGETVLHHAAKQLPHETETLALLLNHAPDLVNARDHHGATPMLALVRALLLTARLCFESLDLFVAAGADPFIANSAGKSVHSALWEDERGWDYVLARPHVFPGHLPNDP
ncbi:hypothetical protein Poli38472_012307 [Pythium oligandrum]|uniref:Ankyrin repeat protein n=1 Tax=Pythium oligandrum TaxID=41045 RepID=A0A8K1CP24_PYTOL|nr:hypothetical protein Poli38472_012307 [Pythium oligandrum]|eukprot:TMW67191.1 hypothetical protein Poli38472_012307 [Pythium oligandrum]